MAPPPRGAALVASLMTLLACNTGTLSKKPDPAAAERDSGRPPAALPDASLLDGPACSSASCTLPGGSYCGRIGDGCGHVLDCPDTCPTGQSCGGAGVAHVCGAPIDPSCVPITCQQGETHLCGSVGDGCGRALDCGACPNAGTCGASSPNVCGAAGATAAGCTNLCTQQMRCPGGATTRVTGSVLAATTARFGVADPLYNAVVYVPNAPLAPFAPGVSCERCGAEISGQPLVTALSGPDGRFTLDNVPAGKDIPLVIQIGRWRRQVKIPEVKACQTTELPGELTRLPRNHDEGDIPLIALATGRWDPLECLLRKIGVDDSEFTVPTGTGRIHLYAHQGLTLGAGTPAGSTLTGSKPTLDKYDVVLLPCDSLDPKPAGNQKNLRDYTAAGGRLFLTDWSFSWLQDGSSFQKAADWSDFLPELGEDFGTIVDQTFPKGKALAQWLEVVKAATGGRVPIHDPYGGFAWYMKVNPPVQRWLYADQPPTAEVFSFNTPIEAAPEAQCGRVVYSTFHVVDEPNGKVFPAACPVGPMTPQEKVLEFMLFDVASCVQPDKEPPRVFRPPVPPPPPPPPEIK
jgi:hypothetical protein